MNKKKTLQRITAIATAVVIVASTTYLGIINIIVSGGSAFDWVSTATIIYVGCISAAILVQQKFKNEGTPKPFGKVRYDDDVYRCNKCPAVVCTLETGLLPVQAPDERYIECPLRYKFPKWVKQKEDTDDE